MDSSYKYLKSENYIQQIFIKCLLHDTIFYLLRLQLWTKVLCLYGLLDQKLDNDKIKKKKYKILWIKMNQGSLIGTNVLMVIEQWFFYFKTGVRENLTTEVIFGQRSQRERHQAMSTSEPRMMCLVYPKFAKELVWLEGRREKRRE